MSCMGLYRHLSYKHRTPNSLALSVFQSTYYVLGTTHTLSNQEGTKMNGMGETDSNHTEMNRQATVALRKLLNLSGH